LIAGEAEGYIGKSQKVKQALGYFYLAKVSKIRNDEQKALEFLATARELFPLIDREVVVLAQITFAGAHQ
jgi:hypothetical protein